MEFLSEILLCIANGISNKIAEIDESSKFKKYLLFSIVCLLLFAILFISFYISNEFFLKENEIAGGIFFIIALCIGYCALSFIKSLFKSIKYGKKFKENTNLKANLIELIAMEILYFFTDIFILNHFFENNIFIKILVFCVIYNISTAIRDRYVAKQIANKYK